jgi:hypothetical protein
MRIRFIIIVASTAIGLFTAPVSAMAVSNSNHTTSSSTASQGASSTSSEEPGMNLAKWLKGWVGAMSGVVVGVVGLAAVAKRSVAEGLALLLVALIVGGFVIAPEAMNSLTTAVWSKIAS